MKMIILLVVVCTPIAAIAAVTVWNAFRHPDRFKAVDDDMNLKINVPPRTYGFLEHGGSEGFDVNRAMRDPFYAERYGRSDLHD